MSFFNTTRCHAFCKVLQFEAFTILKLLGSVLTGTIREGSDIDIHVFAANPHSITVELDDLSVFYELDRKRIVKDGEQRVFTHIHVRDEFPIELTVYHPSYLGYRFRSSITNKAIERAGLSDLERLIARMGTGSGNARDAVAISRSLAAFINRQREIKRYAPLVIVYRL